MTLTRHQKYQKAMQIIMAANPYLRDKEIRFRVGQDAKGNVRCVSMKEATVIRKPITLCHVLNAMNLKPVQERRNNELIFCGGFAGIFVQGANGTMRPIGGGWNYQMDDFDDQDQETQDFIIDFLLFKRTR